MKTITLEALKSTLDENNNAFNTRKAKRDSGVLDFTILVRDLYGEQVGSQTNGKEYRTLAVKYRDFANHNLKEKRSPSFTTEAKSLMVTLEPGKKHTILSTKAGELWKKWTKITPITNENEEI